MCTIERASVSEQRSRILNARWLNGLIKENQAENAVNNAYVTLQEALAPNAQAEFKAAARNDFITALINAELPKLEQVTSQITEHAGLNAFRHASFTDEMSAVVESNFKATLRRVGLIFAKRHENDL